MARSGGISVRQRRAIAALMSSRTVGQAAHAARMLRAVIVSPREGLDREELGMFHDRAEFVSKLFARHRGQQVHTTKRPVMDSCLDFQASCPTADEREANALARCYLHHADATPLFHMEQPELHDRFEQMCAAVGEACGQDWSWAKAIFLAVDRDALSSERGDARVRRVAAVILSLSETYRA